ncbi:MAG: hypothetical protein AVDCRST_MAG41-50, partial [uncultured Corynebacteriales bacterium]
HWSPRWPRWPPSASGSPRPRCPRRRPARWRTCWRPCRWPWSPRSVTSPPSLWQG